MTKVIYSKDTGHFHTPVSTHVIHIFKKHVNVSIDVKKHLIKFKQPPMIK